MRELQETRYQFDRPFVMDSSAYTAQFGETATPVRRSRRGDGALVAAAAGRGSTLAVVMETLFVLVLIFGALAVAAAAGWAIHRLSQRPS